MDQFLDVCQLTADGVVCTAICETITRMRFQAGDLEVGMVGVGAGSEGTAGSHRRKSQEAACNRGKMHDGGLLCVF